MSRLNLNDAMLFQTNLKAPNKEQYHAVLVLVGRLRDLAKQPRTEETARQALAIATEIRQYGNILRDHTPDHLDCNAPYFQRAFLKSIEFWKRFATSSGGLRFDSIGCITLPKFKPDLQPSDPCWGGIDDAILSLGYSPKLCEEVVGSVTAQSSNLLVKLAIADYLTERLENRRDFYTLFCQIYGDVNIPESAIDFIVTDTQVFVCVPYNNEGLIQLEGKVESFTEEHTHSFRDFLSSLSLSDARQRIYFPSVGYFNRDKLDAVLVQELLDYIHQKDVQFLQVTTELVVETFGTMILLMATQEVEKFIIHDAWGHAWQESLCDFEWLYQKMACFDEPLTFYQPSIYSQDLSSVMTLYECIDCNGEENHFNPTRLKKTLDADLAGRLLVAFNACIAELTADITEYKFYFIAQENNIDFPSSSILQSEAVRLDLAFNDAEKHVTSLGAPYLSLVTDSGVRQNLVNELEAKGASTAASEALVTQLVEFIASNYGDFLSTRGLLDVPDSEQVKLTLFQKMQLNLCSIYCAMTGYTDAGRTLAATQDPCPEASLDLLMLTTACFFEEGRSENCWHLDELIEGPLKKWVHQFGNALRLNMDDADSP